MSELAPELDRAAAERRAERIALRLDTIADNYAAVLPMIREAIEKRDDLALGYSGVSEYVADRFGGALTRLGVDVRREVVRELSAAGLSTRAIAPVVGVGKGTIHRDLAGAPHGAPDEPPAVVVGLDGKSYTRSGLAVPEGDDPGEYESECHADPSGGVNELRRLLRDFDKFLRNYYAHPSRTQLDELGEWLSRQQRKTNQARRKTA